MAPSLRPGSGRVQGRVRCLHRGSAWFGYFVWTSPSGPVASGGRAPIPRSRSAGTWGESQVVPVRVEDPEILQARGSPGDVLVDGPARQPQAVTFGVQVVDFQDDLHTGGWPALGGAALTGSRGRPDPHRIALQRQVGMLVPAPIAHQGEPEQVHIEPYGGIQVGGKDLDAQAGRHRPTLSRPRSRTGAAPSR